MLFVLGVFGVVGGGADSGDVRRNDVTSPLSAPPPATPLQLRASASPATTPVTSPTTNIETVCEEKHDTAAAELKDISTEAQPDAEIDSTQQTEKVDEGKDETKEGDAQHQLEDITVEEIESKPEKEGSEAAADEKTNVEGSECVEVGHEEASVQIAAATEKEPVTDEIIEATETSEQSNEVVCDAEPAKVVEVEDADDVVSGEKGEPDEDHVPPTTTSEILSAEPQTQNIQEKDHDQPLAGNDVTDAGDDHEQV